MHLVRATMPETDGGQPAKPFSSTAESWSLVYTLIGALYSKHYFWRWFTHGMKRHARDRPNPTNPTQPEP